MSRSIYYSKDTLVFLSLSFHPQMASRKGPGQGDCQRRFSPLLVLGLQALQPSSGLLFLLLARVHFTFRRQQDKCLRDESWFVVSSLRSLYRTFLETNSGLVDKS